MVSMSRKVLSENECDFSITTYVHLGIRKKDVPSGWALNLTDIKEFIPVLRYEFECFIQINSIIAPCKIRINPRLFYRGVTLKNHLQTLKLNDHNKKIHIEIKFNKNKLNKSLNEFDKETLDYIDTKLLVGKSYSSKGWGLSKDVVSKIFPLEAYDYLFPVYIDGIPAETRINIQTRLFYNSRELSDLLEKLSMRNPKQKIDARIILNENYLELFNKLKKENNNSNRKCIICGNVLNPDDKNAKCFDCLDKELTVLKLKKFLEFFSPSETFNETDLLNLGYTKGQIKIFIYKFEKNGLISVNWDESFQLKDKNIIDEFINKWS